jgi:hypothetical protein
MPYKEHRTPSPGRAFLLGVSLGHYIAAVALAGAAVLGAASTPTAAAAATSHPVITQFSVTDMAVGLTGQQTYRLRVSASDASGIKSIHVLDWSPAANGTRPTPTATAASGWATLRSRTATSETVGVDYTYIDAERMEGDDRAGEDAFAILVTANDGTTYYTPEAGTAYFRFADQLHATTPPSKVRRGAELTLKGQLNWADWDLNRWRANGAQWIKLQYRRPGTSAWVTEGWARTSTTGAVTVAARDHASGWWRLTYSGNTTCAPATSTPQWVTVR